MTKLILFQKGDSGGPLVCADGSSSISRSKDYLFGVLSGNDGISEKALWKIDIIHNKLINRVWSYKKLRNNYCNNTKLLKLLNFPLETPNGPPTDPQRFLVANIKI